MPERKSTRIRKSIDCCAVHEQGELRELGSRKAMDIQGGNHNVGGSDGAHSLEREGVRAPVAEYGGSQGGGAPVR